MLALGLGGGLEKPRGLYDHPPDERVEDHQVGRVSQPGKGPTSIL